MQVAPFLMFQNGEAAEAMALYLSLFDGSAVVSDIRYGTDGPGPEGTIMVAEIALPDMKLRLSDSAITHDFTFTPSNSLFVTCDDRTEFDRITDKLAEGGNWLMPPDDYGFSTRFGWIEDRFGVSWQINQS